MNVADSASSPRGCQGAPSLLQRALEWPPVLSGGEPFIVVHGDDGRVHYADVMAAQRYVRGALNAGGFPHRGRDRRA